ncbi:transposase [Streptomyces sp. NPDC087538]|uniref:transposase n=1 Tax=Streptomyces sp. NPDC087538 TaxID=3365797 RepID=UPI003803E47C
MTDMEWAVVRPLLPVPAWLEGRGGQPEGYCHRAMLDAIRYLVAGGISWRAMPAHFPCRKRRSRFSGRGSSAPADRRRPAGHRGSGTSPPPASGRTPARPRSAAYPPTARAPGSVGASGDRLEHGSRSG